MDRFPQSLSTDRLSHSSSSQPVSPAVDDVETDSLGRVNNLQLHLDAAGKGSLGYLWEPFMLLDSFCCCLGFPGGVGPEPV